MLSVSQIKTYNTDGLVKSATQLSSDKVKNLNYSKSIKIVEQYYLDLTKNLNPSIGLFSMAIEMKKSLYQHEII